MFGKFSWFFFDTLYLEVHSSSYYRVAIKQIMISISQITVTDDTDGIHLNTQRIVGVLILDLVIKLPKIKINLKFAKMNFNQFKLGSLCKITS